MLITGTNVPITVTFDSSVATFQNIVATLWIQNKMVKKWESVNSEITISGDGLTITLPLNEDETREFKPGKAKLEIKGRNATNQTVFWEEAQITVVSRNDKNIDIIP